MDQGIVIVGGGLAGPVLALALDSAGLPVTLVARDDTGAPGRAYAIAAGSLAMLRVLGVADALPDAPINRIVVADGRPGAPPGAELAFDHREVGLSPMGRMVEDDALRPALAGALAASGVRRVSGEVVDQRPGEVALADGSRLAGTLVVACDGRGGRTAARAGIRRVGWGYGQTALTATVGHDRPHGGTAAQVFLPQGPLALLPLAGQRTSVVWSEGAARARTIAALPDRAVLSVLSELIGDRLGALTLEGGRHSYPLALSVTQDLVADRLAVLADAAHVLHPLAGQGLNLGLRDVATLAEVVADAARRGEDPGAPTVLGRYAAWRRSDTAALAVFTDGMARLFSNDIAPLRALRRAGLAAVGRTPALRRAFVREAAGLTGDLPRLLRGEPL